VTDSLHALVPVAPGEPATLVERTARKLTELASPPDCTVSVTFVIDERGDEGDLDHPGVDTLHRVTTEGRRAVAVEYALDRIDESDYVALFDVDLQPDEDFLVECLAELRRRPTVRPVTVEQSVSHPFSGE
jgi:cellulose synthase/poly-beta-1,6-N-acetylglucosamine synthase-like glycosyltransferase